MPFSGIVVVVVAVAVAVALGADKDDDNDDDSEKGEKMEFAEGGYPATVVALACCGEEPSTVAVAQ